MIRQYTYLQVIDNSGAKRAMCISTHIRKVASVGDIIKVSIKAVFPNSATKRKTMYSALIVNTKSVTNIRGIGVSFSDNCVILLDASLNPVGNTVSRPISAEIKAKYPQLTKMSVQTI